ncbi:MAG: fused MFS/spermidine synthase [Pseudomonadota bacterium]|nr:hypothetical protein [Pseudomonadota bacterium]QKK05971.1 MAG: fused MFS/spermidine synthase [Pseudomonadota bacterium]
MPPQADAGRLSSKTTLPHHLTLLVFAVSLFLSASLMFAVQPMVGKMLLPLAGGTPASWIVAMAFFQIALLMGYMLAWMMSRFHIRTHTLLLVGLLGLAFISLPVSIADYAGILEQGGIAPNTVFVVLLFAVGLPFTALSTVSSTLQRLFTATAHKDAQDPYFLYAASNAGSLIGLLSYPLLIEPLFTLHDQSAYWRILYGGLIIMCLICLHFADSKEEAVVEKKNRAAETADDEEVTWHQRTTWLMLAFFPSSLLMGTTMHITTDMVSAPLLWVLPLGIYLITHIMAFAKRRLIPENFLHMAHPVAVVMIIMLSTKMRLVPPSWTTAALVLGAFFLIALALHTRLAASRPHSKHLTQFYFFLALGGALGGSFNAFIAPLIFNSVLEFPLIALLSCMMNPFFDSGRKNSKVIIAGCVLLGLHIMGSWAVMHFTGHLTGNFRHLLLIFILALIIGHHPKTAMLGCLAIMFITQLTMPVKTLQEFRNFFGIARIYDKPVPRGAEQAPVILRHFMHGTTLHGLQRLEISDQRNAPAISYYGPLTTAIDAFHPRHVALLGLGAGTIRCYDAPGRYYTMYEIDPDVVVIAAQYFDYLNDCSTDKDRIIIGDGRLEMQKRVDDRYDMIIMDAFTSDNVPVHLITEEAFALYRRRLTKNGVIAVHISNRYLDFKPLIPVIAARTGLKTLYYSQPADSENFQVASQWVVLIPQDGDAAPLLQKGWKLLTPQENAPRSWTDDYSNILSLL